MKLFKYRLSSAAPVYEHERKTSLHPPPLPLQLKAIAKNKLQNEAQSFHIGRCYHLEILQLLYSVSDPSSDVCIDPSVVR